MSQGRKTAVTATAVATIVTSILLAASARPVRAQAAQDQAAPGNAAAGDVTAAGGTTAANPATGAGTQTLQEVVVTAERREENIQTTPISIVATSGAQLAQQNVVQIQTLQLYTPSLSFNNDGLYQSPSIRGLGTAFSPSLPLGVALIEDGLFIAEQHGFGDPFYDIADVETLRGPQGTFIGYNSTAGAIEITSVNPNFRGTNGYVELQVGNYSDTRTDGAWNFVLDPDKLAVRLAFNVEKMHSFYRDIGSIVTAGNAEPLLDPGQTDNKDWRLSTLWKPSDAFQALLKIQYTNSEDQGDPAQINPTPFTLPNGAATCPDGSRGPICHANYFANTSPLPFVLDWVPQNGVLSALGHPYYNWRDGLKLDFTFADGTDLRSVTGFEQTQYNTLSTGCGGCNLPVSGGSYQWIPRDDYYSEEVDLISPTTGDFYSKFNYVVGGSWFYRDTGVTVQANTETPPYSATTPLIVSVNNDTIARIMGVFGQVSWQIMPTLQLQVGARENWDSDELRGAIDQVAIPHIIPATAPSVGCFETPAPPTGYFCSTPNQLAPFQDHVPTGKIDLNWTPAPGQFFYAFYARGYKGGVGIAEGTVAKPLPAQAVLPEHVNDWELGWNGTMLAGHLRTHLGGYWMVDQNSQQAGIFNPLTGGTQVENIGSETLKGIEASMQGRFGGFGVNFDGSYEKSSMQGIPPNVATYALPPTAGSKGQCGYPGVNPASCFDYAGMDPGDPNYYVTIAGETGTYAPELQGTLGVDYVFNVGQGTLDPQISYSYTSKQYASLFQIPFYTLPARHLWNATLTYDVNQWEVEAYDTNFTNQIYYSGIMGTSVFYGNPMQVGVRVRRNF